MECLQKPIWNSFEPKELSQLIIELPDEECRKQVLRNWDSVSKPLDGMGKFEAITAQIGAICGTDNIDIAKKAVIIMCADNGVVEEGISQSGQEVTAIVAEHMAAQATSVGKMAVSIGADTIPVDIGINREMNVTGLLPKKVRFGTGNFRQEPAMTEQEAIRAIAVGIEMVYSCKEAGYHILGTGEMGIGNTTTSSAVAAALLSCEVDKVTGRGAGLSEEGLLRKRQVISEAIEKYGLRNADALTVLRTVGGLDIAGLVGVCMGGALFHIPVVLDGVISMVAALVAERLLPGVKAYLIPSHTGKEPASKYLEKALNFEPVIDARLALGEGTGAVMMFGLLDIALSVYSDENNRSTFKDAKIEQYKRF